jgi:1,4-alpha-glucan branching enzyme
MEKKDISKNTPQSRAVTFEFYAPQAKKVCVAGTFNNWDAADTALQKDRNGHWQITLPLKSGRYEYRYLVDGQWQNDQRNVPTVKNPFGEANCIIEVPGKDL